MPCHVSATSMSCRRQVLCQKRPPTIAAKLDLSKPGESWAEDYLRRASTGNDAFWRPLGIRRADAALFVAVRWLIGKKRERFSVVTISLTEHAVSWRKYPSGKAAKAALADIDRKPMAQTSTTTSTAQASANAIEACPSAARGDGARTRPSPLS